MQNKLFILKRINQSIAKEIIDKYPADWNMDKIFSESFKKYTTQKQRTFACAEERAVNVRIIRKNVFVKVIAVLALLAATAVAAAAFSRYINEHHENKPAVIENYFVDESYTVPECVVKAQNVLKLEDSICISGIINFDKDEKTSGQDQGQPLTGTGLCITDLSGNVTKKTKLSDGQIENVFMADNHDIYIYLSQSSSGCDNNKNETLSNIVEHLNPDGTIIETAELDIEGLLSDSDFLVDTKGRYILTDQETNMIYLLDSDGSVISQVKCTNETQKLHAFINNDSIFQLSELNGITEIRKIDFDNKTTEKIAEPDFPLQYNDKVFRGNNLYDFIISENDGIYGYNIHENELTEIVNYVDSDISYSVNDVWYYDTDNFFYAFYENESANNRKLCLMTRADGEALRKIQQKKLITVAGNVRELEQIAAEFNDNSKEYRIKIKDYSKYWLCESGSSGRYRYSKLNEDIINGNIPDLIICDSEFDFSRFASTGVFTDLNEMIENDSEINRSDFFENILDAYETDGKLYCMPLSFSLCTLSGKMSVLGEHNKLTYDQFFQMNNNQKVLCDEAREFLMDAFIRNNLSEFVDYRDLSCSFDDDNFISLLEYIRNSGITIDEYNKIMKDDDLCKEYRRRVAEDRCSCFMENVYSFDIAADNQQITLGQEKEISYIGLPSKTGGGAAADSPCIMAIAENSKNKDAASEFLKSLLSEENQMKNKSGFPIVISAFDRMSKKAQEYNGPSGTQEDLYGKQIIKEKADSELVSKILSLTESVDRTAVYDSQINAIIGEQTKMYFDGSQSAMETAKQIQKKAQTYLNDIK